MGLTRSLSTGASSLRANQQRFDVISNNLANTNTIGYKSNRANFEEQFNQIAKYGKAPDSVGGNGIGGINPIQFGLGVKMGSITQDMSQGTIETTNRPLDMAMQGDGFFVYNMNGKELYSRAGNVSRDAEGFLIDTGTGAYLQGYNAETDNSGAIIKDANGLNNLTGMKQNLQIPDSVISAPKQTETAALKGNLNSGNAENTTKKTGIKIFDGVGGSHDLRITFTKTANPNEYSIAGDINGNAVNLNNSTLTFNNDGTLNTPLSLAITAADLNTAVGTPVFDATTPKDITITLAEANKLTAGLTSYSASNTATFIEQDGYQSGSLLDMNVDTKGQVWGAFTNGVTERLGQVVVAKFTNQEGLTRTGGNFYSQTPNSGLAVVGTAGDMFPSTKIAGNSLEMSNVDMTIQFTEMISTQRAFEAASRTITISDQLLAETTMLKR